MPVPSPDKWGGLEKAMVNYPVKTAPPEHFMARFKPASSIQTDSGSSKQDGSLQTTREEPGPASSSQGVYDTVRENPMESPTVNGSRDKRSSVRSAKYYQIRTWNARGMSLGKLEIVKREMIRTHIDILDITELHRTGNGQFQTDGFVVYFSGNDSVRRKEVTFIASKWVAR